MNKYRVLFAVEVEADSEDDAMDISLEGGIRSDDFISMKTMNTEEALHGYNCCKVPHMDFVRYAHGEGDDYPYNVDGVSYCGRCHAYLDEDELERVKGVISE